MNLLILSCGTRDLLVRYFKKSSFDRIIAVDCSELAPALYEADRYRLVPRMDDPEYLDRILSICREEQIDAVLPLQEDELKLIADHRRRFEEKGIVPVVSAGETLEICRDKYRFYCHLQKAGIPSLRSFDTLEAFRKEYKEGKIDFPVFIKPTRGCGSIGAMKVNKMEVLEALIRNSDTRLLIQEYCQGEEFGADIYVDLITGQVTDLFVKKKLRMRAGETEKSVTWQDEELNRRILETVGTLELRGPVDMDIFSRDGEYFVSEINPRFGGGFPHAYACGMNVPEYLAENIAGRANPPRSFGEREELYVLKYSDVYVMKKERL